MTEFNKYGDYGSNWSRRRMVSQAWSVLRRAISLDPDDKHPVALLKGIFEIEAIAHSQPPQQRKTRFNSYGEIEE